MPRRPLTMPPLCAALALLAACDPSAGPGTGSILLPGEQASATTATGRAWFREVAGTWGLDFTHSVGSERRFLLPETLAGGVALFDFDGDGWLDVYLVQGGDALVTPGAPSASNRLYRNLGPGGPGRPGVRFADVTAESGTGDTGYGMGAACGDVDGDGDVDLYVTNVGANRLFRNDGDGRFTEVGETAGVADPSWSTSAAFLDFDADGDLDLFVTSYVEWSADTELECWASWRERVRDYCRPQAGAAAAQDRLYRNRGDGVFEDVTQELGLEAARGNGLGVTWGDFDGDGRVDVYVSNDATPNQLWLQRANGHFDDHGLVLGCAVGSRGHAGASAGVAAVDLQGDGDLDLVLASGQGEPGAVYQRERGLFSDRGTLLGVGAATRPFTGFGLVVQDFDGDGWSDLFVANGGRVAGEPSRRRGSPYAEPNQLFAGGARGIFSEQLPRGGTGTEVREASRAAAAGDLDNDGDVDLVVVNQDAAVHVLENAVGQDRTWIGVEVLDRAGRSALGARVRVHVGEHAQERRIMTAGGFQASHDPRVTFGLDEAVDAVEVTVIVAGTESGFGPLEPGRYHTLVLR